MPRPQQTGPPPMGTMGRISALSATFPHVLPLPLKAPWLGGRDLTLIPRAWGRLAPLPLASSCPSTSRSVCSASAVAPTLCGLCRSPPAAPHPCRGPAAALLCHLLSHTAAHPLHVHQPLPGHLHHLHHLPQRGHHVPGALQPAHGEPGPASGPRPRGGVGSSARPHPRDGAGQGLNRPHWGSCAQEAQGLV